MQIDTSAKPGRPSQAGAYVARRIGQLINTGNEAMTKANLACLRRGIGKPPGSLPDLWGLTMDGMPEDLVGTGREPSWGEWACYLALTLYALHQQGKDWKTAPMHLPGQGLGKAIRKLAKNDEEQKRIKRRFDQVVTSDSPQEAAHHLRSMIQLLRAQDIPLDYAALAQDLYRYQNPDERDRVRLSWGRDFYAYTGGSNDKEQSGTPTTESEENLNDEE